MMSFSSSYLKSDFSKAIKWIIYNTATNRQKASELLVVQSLTEHAFTRQLQP
jgi:hypothetical protein